MLSFFDFYFIFFFYDLLLLHNCEQLSCLPLSGFVLDRKVENAISVFLKYSWTFSTCKICCDSLCSHSVTCDLCVGWNEDHRKNFS